MCTVKKGFFWSQLISNLLKMKQRWQYTE
uniref:Uncharacterized protein n=1 Tax=Anguilla anguilla TaxID=7936 RepID=A0A0E9QWT1_ANGAN